jgi:arsenate reductase (glutaredoxin)
MNIQIYGKKKCFDTQKAERYFKERKIKYQYIDLIKYGLSKRELESVKTSVGIEELFNKDIKDYTTLNLDKIRGSDTRAEILLNNPKLYKSPVVRNGSVATVGFKPDIWEKWD